LAGSLGDLGVFIPLLTAMVALCGLQLGPTLFCTGAMNVGAGLAFGIPLSVQPMKIIAAVAISDGLNESEILTAGIVTGAAVLFLAVTGLIDWLSRVIPKSVVRGLQLALGLKLLVMGVDRIAETGTWFAWDSIGMGLFCTILVLALYNSARIPPAMLVFGIGLVALLAAHPELLRETHLGMTWRIPDLSNATDWKTGSLLASLPQLPMTVLNSVIAVGVLSMDLFPARPAAPRRVALSVALMNLISCPLGSMPVCHGAGGMAAQYRFGARTGGSMVFLGIVSMALAILLGNSLLAWLQHYPASVLGVLLVFSGAELALVCRDQTKRADFFVMILTAGTCMAVNTAAGFAAGWAVGALLFKGFIRVEKP
jgi:hypothetical protein